VIAHGHHQHGPGPVTVLGVEVFGTGEIEQIGIVHVRNIDGNPVQRDECGDIGLLHLHRIEPDGVTGLAAQADIQAVVLDDFEFEAMLELAVKLDQPVALRYPKSVCPQVHLPLSPLELGRAEIIKRGSDFTLIGLGSMVAPCFEAIEALAKLGLSGTLINARFIRPLDLNLIVAATAKTDFIFTVEEGIIDGGFGSAVLEQIDQPITRIGLPSEFIVHGKREIILNKYGLTAQGITERVRKTIKQNG